MSVLTNSRHWMRRVYEYTRFGKCGLPAYRFQCEVLLQIEDRLLRVAQGEPVEHQEAIMRCGYHTANSKAAESSRWLLDCHDALCGRLLFGPRGRLYSIAPQRLRAIERSIGRIEQRAEIRTLFVGNRNADADG